MCEYVNKRNVDNYILYNRFSCTKNDRFLSSSLDSIKNLIIDCILNLGICKDIGNIIHVVYKQIL